MGNFASGTPLTAMAENDTMQSSREEVYVPVPSLDWPCSEPTIGGRSTLQNGKQVNSVPADGIDTEGRMNMRLGIILAMEDKIRERILDIKGMGFDNIQLSFWSPSYYTDHWLTVVQDALQETGLELTHFWAGFDPPVAWNFYDGPISVGLVPEAYRDRRTQQVLKGARFAGRLGVQYVATHLGFLPEDPNDPLYMGTLIAVNLIAKQLAGEGQTLLFETGQETPTTLVRAIEDIGTGNLGINFDTANLILYGKDLSCRRFCNIKNHRLCKNC